MLEGPGDSRRRYAPETVKRSATLADFRDLERCVDTDVMTNSRKTAIAPLKLILDRIHLSTSKACNRRRNFV